MNVFNGNRNIRGIRNLILLGLVPALLAVAGCGNGGLTTAGEGTSGSGLIIGGIGSGGTGVVKASLIGMPGDGCLANALVFADTNGNRRLDDGEPRATTDATCGYTLETTGNHPLLVLTIAGITVDTATNRVATENSLAELAAANVAGEQNKTK